MSAIEEAEKLLEKARFELPVLSTNIPTRKLIGEALAKLRQSLHRKMAENNK